MNERERRSEKTERINAVDAHHLSHELSWVVPLDDCLSLSSLDSPQARTPH
jgi:hypothetical protein